ncbi:MAG TPA: TldD/PmbA family protein, partial [bacterium]|nr:TldD/PmbA family protein [bacterium]
MNDLLIEMRDYLKRRGADYADLRFESAMRESVEVRNGKVERVSSSQDQGVGVRVLLGGGWGFAATSESSRQALRQTSNLAMEVARASALVSRHKVILAQQAPQKGEYRSPCEKDPFEVPLSVKIDLLMRACDTIQRDERIRVARGNIRWSKTRKWFLNTEGTETQQEIIVSAAGIEATAVSGNDAQKRSYPAGHEGDAATRGFEFIEQMNLPGNAVRVREEALMLLDAPECPAGAQDVILSGSQMALQIHES